MSQHCPHCRRPLEFPGGAAFCCYCGGALAGTQAPEAATAPVAAPAKAPERLGDYRLLRKLGQGGMGTVFEAVQESTGRRVAVKLIDAEATPEALARFRQEGRLASALAHPRCVFVLAADEDQGRPYIVFELLTGGTLDDLVARRGPLPIDEALRHTLDIIDGLEQVHRLGVVHRDVKPSNCFLDTDGRVKLGDFGLARALQSDHRLTQAGAFVGTPLFAAPEQVKGGPLDGRADVYAVCATLYFLLTAKAPHDAGDGDAMAMLARVVADDAPPLRSRRAGLPAGLERVVMRGLARDRDRRWPDLVALRRALAAFQPPALRLDFLGLRAVVLLLDAVSANLVWSVCLLLAARMEILASGVRAWVILVAFVSFPALYVGLWEGLAGFTPAKWLCGLRVSRAGDVLPPGLLRGLSRAALWWGLVLLIPGLLEEYVAPQGDPARRGLSRLLFPGLPLAAVAVMCSTMRRANGYRGLHEVLTGTHTTPAPTRQRGTNDPTAPALPAWPSGLPQRVGPFDVQGQLSNGPGGQVLVALDPSLDRRVWVWRRPAGAPPLPHARRELFRPARLSWLAGGDEQGRPWDAFLAPTGCPLDEAARRRGPLPWEEARPLIEQFAAELERARVEGTAPAVLTLAQVWLSPDGRVLLLDLPGEGAPLTPVELLSMVSQRLLEGGPRREGDHSPPRVPLPRHARSLLESLPLFGGKGMTVDDFAHQLERTRDWPTHVTPGLRAWQLTALAISYLLFQLFWPEIVPRPREGGEVWEIAWRLLFPLLCVLSAAAFRGGLRHRSLGVEVVRRDGAAASRLRCGWRAALAWFPVLGLELASWNRIAFPIVVLTLIIACLVWPDRSPHDRLAGTRLVPR